MKKLLIAFAGCAILLTGCRAGETPSPGASPSETPSTSTSTTPSPSGTPTPTGTLSPDQQAALDAKNKVDAVDWTLHSNPAGYTEKEIRKRIAAVAMEPLRSGLIDSVLQLRRAKQRMAGGVKVLSVKVGRIEKLDGGALRVVITRCLDQRELRVLDKKGAVVPDKYPDWQLQEAALRKAKGSKTWLQAGSRPASTKKCVVDQ